MTRDELEAGRHSGHRTYGYFWSFCRQNSCCEDCDKMVRIGCRLKRKVEDLQTRRILRICKPEQRPDSPTGCPKREERK